MNPLLSRLAALRRSMRLVSTVRGSCATLAVLVGSLAAACLLDIIVYKGLRLELPGLIRGLLLAATLAGTSLIGYLWLLRPLAEKLNNLSLALRVEEQYPILNDALASTVEFLQTSGTPDRTVSPTLKREAVQRAMRLMNGCDFNKAIDTRGLRLSLVSLGVAFLVVLPLLLLFPAEAGTALVPHVIDPFGENPWVASNPQTFVEMDYPKKAAYGKKLVIRGTVTGYIPEKRVAVFEFSGYLKASLEVKFDLSEDGKTGSIHVDLPMAQQQRDFRFRVRVGDGVSPKRPGTWHEVTLHQPPRLLELAGKASPQIELTFPPYTDLESPLALPPGQGNIDAVEGTLVKLQGAADRPLGRATIDYKPTMPVARELAALLSVGASTPLEAVALWRGGREVWHPVEAIIAPGGLEFSFAFQPRVQGDYLLTIEDQEGLSKTYEFKLNLFPDPIPKVELEQPARNRSVLPSAEITVQVSAQDDLYALRTVYLEVRRKDQKNPGARDLLLRLSLYDHQDLETVLPQLQSIFAAHPVPVPLPRLHLRPKTLNLTRLWSLKGLVKEGDVLVVQAFADDFNRMPFRQPGQSHEVELRIVGRSTMAAVVDEAQAQLAQKIAKIRDLQDKAIKKVEGAEKQWKATGKIRPEDAVAVAEAELLQKQIQGEVGVEEQDGLRGEVAKLQKLLKENKLLLPGVQGRLNAIKTELDRLADGPLKKIEGKLFQSRQELENKVNARPPTPKEKNDLVKAHEQQHEVKRVLDDLLGYLENWAGVNEFKAELRAILLEQQDLHQKVEKLQEQAKKPMGLTPEEVQDIRDIAALQSPRLSGRTLKLIEKMERVSLERAGKNDIRTAKLLENAAEIGRTNSLPGEMEDTAKVQLLNPKTKDGKGGPQLYLAAKQMQNSIKILELMLEALEEQDSHMEGLVKKHKQDQKKLEEFGERLEKLRKRTQQANQIADPRERQAALEKIAAEEGKLQEDLQKKARELARLQAPQAAKKLEQAAKDLDKAGKNIAQGQNPEELQKEAQKKIDQAKKNLKDEQQKAEDELAREIQSKLVDHIRALKERQDAALVESARIHKALLQNNRWQNALRTTFDEHISTQTGLAKDTDLLKKKLKGAVVFAMVLDKAIQAMEEAKKAMLVRNSNATKRQALLNNEPFTKEELADENRLDQLTQKHQRDASKRLERLLEALKDNLEMTKNDGQGGDEGGGGDGGGKAKGRPVDGIPPMAQLKVLRDEQQDLNQRTLEFAERKLDLNNLTMAQQRELDALVRDQERLGELFLNMQKAVQGEGANP